jgi:hypothetical protein
VLKKKLAVLVAMAMMLMIMVVASAAPGMAAGKKYCVYKRGFHFISAKKFHQGNYTKYPAKYWKGQAPGVG